MESHHNSPLMIIFLSTGASLQSSKHFGDYREMTVRIINTVYLRGLELLAFTTHSLYDGNRSRGQEDLSVCDSMKQLYGIKSRFTDLYSYVYITSKRKRK
jgi:hypothetical protein